MVSLSLALYSHVFILCLRLLWPRFWPAHLHPQPKGRDVFYCIYQTSIQCSSGVATPAELRVYSPPGDDPLAEDTVIFLLAKVYIPTSGKALLDAICLFPVPGVPSDDKYENSIPDMQFPMVIAPLTCYHC